MDKFRCITSIQTRYSDFDMLGHLNNAVYVTYYETARIDYFKTIGWELEQITNVVARSTINFIKPVRPGDELKVKTRISSIGNTSFTMDYILISEKTEEILNKATTVQVCVDRSDQRPISVPEDIREKINSFESRV